MELVFSWIVLLIVCAPLLGMAIIMLQMGCELVFLAVRNMRRKPQTPLPAPSMVIPRRVDLRDQWKVDAWLYRRSLH